MKLIFSAILLLSSMNSFALPLLDTKERVRMELWFEGVDHSTKKVHQQDEKQLPELPVELEHALLKF